MAVYEYTARDENGIEFYGTYLDAESKNSVQTELTKMGYTLVKACRKKDIANRFTRIRQSEIVQFIYKLAGMTGAGLSISKCLTTLKEQTENPRLKSVVSDILDNIESGSGLKDAFEKHRNVFGSFLIGMLEAGENNGKISETLEASAVYMEKQMDMGNKIKSAFMYPCVVGITCLCVVFGLVIFVIPVFSKLYKQLHVQLPWATQMLINLSVFIRYWWWTIPIIIAAGVYFVKYLLIKPEIKAKWDKFKLNVPVFSKLYRIVAVSHFIKTFSMLAAAGVSYVKALKVADMVVDNSSISVISQNLQDMIEKGHSVTSALKSNDLFPPIIVQLAESGENSGLLPDMLNKGVEFLDKDIHRITNSLLVKLEPVMTVIMGTIVGLILIGVYLPMFDYMSHLK